MEPAEQEMDVVSRAVREFIDMVETGEDGADSPLFTRETLKIDGLVSGPRPPAASPPPSPSRRRRRGGVMRRTVVVQEVQEPWPPRLHLPFHWCQKAPSGMSKGATYIGPFKHIIRAWFQMGVEAKGNKRSPAQMHEDIERLCIAQDRFDVPSPEEIALYVGGLAVQSSKPVKEAAADKQAHKLTERFAAVFSPLRQWFDLHPDASNGAAVTWLEQQDFTPPVPLAQWDGTMPNRSQLTAVLGRWRERAETGGAQQQLEALIAQLMGRGSAAGEAAPPLAR
jgi:hypothetical protein